MFTGIIEAVTEVLSLQGSVLTLKRPLSFDDVRKGSSVCVSGVCLTVADMMNDALTFDVVQTTREKSTLGSLAKRDKVNLERALKADGRFDGHIVQGHSEGIGTVVTIESAEGNTILTLDLPAHLSPFVVTHGSITLDGVSLTVAEKDADRISVALVPFTLKETTLGNLEAGDRVNIETDILAKYLLSRKNLSDE